jgi:hypothetical protein
MPLPDLEEDAAVCAGSIVATLREALCQTQEQAHAPK